MMETAALVSAQELLGEQSAWAGVPVGQYSAGNARVPTPSLRQVRARPLWLLQQNQHPRAECGLASRVCSYGLCSE